MVVHLYKLVNLTCKNSLTKHATVRQNVMEIKTKFYKYYSSCHVAHWFSFNPFNAKDVLIEFTLSNARRFYSSKGNPLALKGFKKTILLNPFSAKDILINFTLSNARRFYLSKGNPLALNGLNDQNMVQLYDFLFCKLTKICCEEIACQKINRKCQHFKALYCYTVCFM